jgi:preprotein translocase subunit SecD
MRLRRRLAACLALLLVVTVAGCSDDDASTTLAGDITFSYQEPEGGVDDDALETLIRARLEGLGILLQDVDTSTPGSVTVGLDDERLADLASALLVQGVLRIRPVLAHTEGASPDVALTPVEQDAADQPVTLPQDDDEGAIVGTWQLGPAVVDFEAIESATVVEAGAQPAIELGLATPALVELNNLAALCVTLADACPTGQVAITVDGAVVAAPQVTQPSFAADQVEFAPQLDPLAVRQLAIILDTGPLPVALTPGSFARG